MLMLSTALMDMVLDIPPTLDLSMEDTPPTPDQSMEDTQATMEREMLRLNQRLMLFTAPMDMVLDLSTENTPPTPDQLSPAMPDQLFHPLDTLPTLDQSTEDTPEVFMDSTKPAFYQKENQRH